MATTTVPALDGELIIEHRSNSTVLTIGDRSLELAHDAAEEVAEELGWVDPDAGCECICGVGPCPCHQEKGEADAKA